jgi:CHASE3 domain sensor protein
MVRSPRRRTSVLQKIIAGIAMVTAAAIIAVGVVHHGLSRVVASMDQLAEVRLPSHAAALEVELNLNGVVLATLAYIDHPDAEHRQRLEKDQQDIDLHYQRFLDLASTAEERLLARRLGSSTRSCGI